MLAAVVERPGQLTMRQVPTPRPGPGEVLVEVQACGVCGTDLHILHGDYWGDYPRVPGHEFSGVVVEVGAGVSAPGVGRRVAINPNLPCGLCTPCRRGRVNLCEANTAVGVTRDGGFAELCVVPATLALPLPDNVSFAAGAMAEPLSCCLHGLDRARPEVGWNVVVLGGGSIGLILMQLARLAGATRTVVIEPQAAKRELALALGATVALTPEEAEEAVGPAGLVIEAAGRPETAARALELVSPGGTVLLFGVCPAEAEIPLRPHDVFFRELTVVGSYTNPFTTARAIALLGAGAVEVEALVTHRLPLDRTAEAMAAMAGGQATKALVCR